MWPIDQEDGWKIDVVFYGELGLGLNQTRLRHWSLVKFFRIVVQIHPCQTHTFHFVSSQRHKKHFASCALLLYCKQSSQ